jgi:protein gp37
MSDNSKIEWTGASWPVTAGCDHVSAGCDNCYAAQLTSGRLRHRPEYAGLAEHGKFNGTVRCLPERLDWPLHWRKPRRIFVCSMSDLFHESVPDEFIACVFVVMAVTPQHTYQLLTKRHGRMRSLLSSPEFQVQYFTAAASRGWDLEGTPWPLPNVWLGVSAEDQKWTDIRVPALLDTPAAVRFISAEPLLGPIDLGVTDHRDHDRDVDGTGWGHVCLDCSTDDEDVRWFIYDQPSGIDWVIAGGESGPRSRPCELEWLRSLHLQCALAGIPYFCKQLGSVLGRELGAGLKGGDWSAWPEDLKIRQFPDAAKAALAHWPALARNGGRPPTGLLAEFAAVVEDYARVAARLAGAGSLAQTGRPATGKTRVNRAGRTPAETGDQNAS